MVQPISTLGKYIMLMGRVFSRPERFKMYFKQYVNEMIQLGFNSIGIVLLISFSSERLFVYRLSLIFRVRGCRVS